MAICACISTYIIILGHTPDTAAALKTFDECYAVIEGVDPFVFIPKCISYGVFQGDDMYTSGGSIFLNNQMKLELALPQIRKLISLNGVDVFDKLLDALHSEPNYKRLANHMKGTYLATCYYDCLLGHSIEL